MKEAILFEPKLLAEVERESPALYEYYCTTPFHKYDYTNYGIRHIPMFMRKDILLTLKSDLNHDRRKYKELLKTFIYGWEKGLADLFIKICEDNTFTFLKETAYDDILEAALNDSAYDLDTLVCKDHMLVHNNNTYSDLTYRDAQCHFGWGVVLKFHLRFDDSLTSGNPIWVKPNVYQES